METFEDRFKKLRGEMSKVEFAKKIGITKQKVSNYEKGIVKPTYDVFYLLAQKLNVNINWLLTGKGEIYQGNRFISRENVQNVQSDVSKCPKLPTVYKSKHRK